MSSHAFVEHVTIRETNSGLRMLFDRERGVMYELNETASAIVSLLQQGVSDSGDLVDALGAEYDAPLSELRSDVQQFLDDFVDIGLLAVASAEPPR